MSIQEFQLTNNQKKLIVKAIKDNNVIIQEDNGDLVINVAAYLKLKVQKEASPLEDILEEAQEESGLDYSAEYFVFT